MERGTEPMPTRADERTRTRVKIVSWNMNHCMRSPAVRAKAWEYLRDELHADVAVVQEALPPPELMSVFHPIDEKHPRYRWGSAVVAFRSDLVLRERPRVPLADCKMKPVTGSELPDSHPGACAVADVLDTRGRSQFTAISLYGQWEVMADGRTMYSCARFHRMLSDLTGVLARSGRHPVVLAGDLNLTTQVAYSGQTRAETAGAEAALARIRAWGLTDCVAHTHASRTRLVDCSCPEGDACSHVQTFRLKNRADSRPTQLDYAFVSDTIVPKLIGCQVVDEEAAWQLSDHCPIVLELKE